jgi:hypothetical protein
MHLPAYRPRFTSEILMRIDGKQCFTAVHGQRHCGLGAVGYLRARPVRAERPDVEVLEDTSVTVAGKLAAQL